MEQKIRQAAPVGWQQYCNKSTEKSWARDDNSRGKLKEGKKKKGPKKKETKKKGH